MFSINVKRPATNSALNTQIEGPNLDLHEMLGKQKHIIPNGGERC